jgi:hypothetical protein
MKKILVVMLGMMIFASTASATFESIGKTNERDELTIESVIESPIPKQPRIYYGCQWERDYGKIHMLSARYEGPQPIGDADNDGKNELLIGGRDPFLRVMKWNDAIKTYVVQALIIDPVFNDIITCPTGFAIGDVDNDGKNEIGVAWARHFSAFKWDGFHYKKIGMYVIATGEGWQSTLDCIIGDCDNDGKNEVVVTGSYSDPDIPEVLVLSWDGEKFVEKSSWDAPGRSSVYFPWIADVDDDGENEIICGPGNKLVVLDWDGNQYIPTIIKTYDHTQIFGCVSKDSDNDGKSEIHVTFDSPKLEIWEWNGSGYEEKWSHYWHGEGGTIEAIDVGDVDDDGIPEVCVGTNRIHVLQWNGANYEEEAMIPTCGCLSVTAIGDCDNDGKNEINAASVIADHGQSYKEWVFKYGYEVPHGYEETIRPHWRSFYWNDMDRSHSWVRYWAKNITVHWKWSTDNGDHAYLYVDDLLKRTKSGRGEETVTFNGSLLQARMVSDKSGIKPSIDLFGIYGCAIDEITFRS